MANVLHLFRALQRRLPMEEVAEVRALQDSGLEGCAHARTGSPRQVLLVDSETLELMELSPGIIRENPWNQCEWTGRRPATSGGSCATGGQHGVHSVRHARKNQAWLATGNPRETRDAMPGYCRRNDTAGRPHRENFLAIRGSGLPP